MYYPIAFFDVDSLELSAKGITFVCHPQVSSISEELYEIYGIISGVAAPLVFSMDVNRNTPGENSRRRDFLTVPLSEDEDWKASVTDWYKFYIDREVTDDIEKLEIFKSNTNTKDCIKLINSKEWIVFGNGIEHKVDHVITSLLEFVETVKFIPELIIPGETETKEQLESYCKKWEEKGAIRMSFDDVTEVARCHQY